ncbi:hypothetical protein E2C01_102466 [Portunus trituberculatus]|uniref:Uncharacterized protein n=1 Tax=Portunus trituberculatus TaxID=210409 RepID=A0A5B7KD91_PORTR|nr:hypothetical protein [Portunus trituberculatus]
MIVNRSEDESNAVWKIGENEMNQAQEYKYCGMWVSPSGCEKTKNDKLGLVNQWVGRLGSAARMRSSKYDVLREKCGRVWLCPV